MSDRDRAAGFEGWQLLHSAAPTTRPALAAHYDAAGVKAKVVDYCSEMGLAYRAADLVISRAGAGSVAEAWANTVPTIFLPNPYHKDQHQTFNAQPMVDSGGALLIEDRIDAPKTVAALQPALTELMGDAERRDAMRAALDRSRPSRRRGGGGRLRLRAS